MATQIFSTYRYWVNRDDKSLNGVSHEFADRHPNWLEMNAANTGRWNCDVTFHASSTTESLLAAVFDSETEDDTQFQLAERLKLTIEAKMFVRGRIIARGVFVAGNLEYLEIKSIIVDGLHVSAFHDPRTFSVVMQTRPARDGEVDRLTAYTLHDGRVKYSTDQVIE
jgi:hypothetical protein